MYFLELEKHCSPPNLQRHWAIVLNVFEETIKYGSQNIYNPYLPAACFLNCSFGGKTLDGAKNMGELLMS